MELRELNLNLLLSLEALLETAHVSRAAERMGVTQSAMSHTLKQLREQLGDPLLVRSASGLLLTPRAERLQVALRRGFAEIRRGLTDEASEDARARPFTLVAPDHLASVLVPTVSRAFLKSAPRAELIVRSLDPRNYLSLLETGEVDIVLSVERPDLAYLRSRRLFEDEFACAVRLDHPTQKKKPTLAQYAALEHVINSPTGRGSSPIDGMLDARGVHRRVAVRVPSLLVAASVVAESEYVVTAPKRFLDQVAPRFGLRVFPLPLDIGRFRAFALWHERFDSDPGASFFRELVVEVAAPRD